MLNLTLPDMSCGHCTNAITQALKALDPDCSLEFDLAEHSVKIDSKLSQEELVRVLTEEGYPPA